MKRLKRRICISTTPHVIASRLPLARSGQGKKAVRFAGLRSKLARKTVRKRLVRLAFLVVNLLLLTAVTLVVVAARHNDKVATPNVSSATPTELAANPLDQISSADIAFAVSTASGMTEQTAIKNQSESADIQLATSPVTDQVVSKPQIISTTFKSNKDIQTYTSQAGDSVSSLAAKFNVTSDSIRWSNNLSGEAIAAGSKLLIPPVGFSGIVYTVKAGDTIDSIATKYNADKSALITANDAEIKGIQLGEQIIIPGGVQPAAPVVKRAATASYSTGFAWGNSAIYGYNGYDYGYCTWWVAERRMQVGKPLPSNLGNASSWGYIGRSAGLAEGNTPQVYAAAVTSTAGEGHVVFVEAVNADGSIVISEMNHLGWAVKDTMTIPAATAARYIYIY